jgi:hypothetical protein
MFKSPPNPIKRRANEISGIQAEKIAKGWVLSRDDSRNPLKAG